MRESGYETQAQYRAGTARWMASRLRRLGSNRALLMHLATQQLLNT